MTEKTESLELAKDKMMEKIEGATYAELLRMWRYSEIGQRGMEFAHMKALGDRMWKLKQTIDPDEEAKIDAKVGWPKCKGGDR